MRIEERILWRWREWRYAQAGLLCVWINSPTVGFFAQMSAMMGVLSMSERRRLKPYIILSSEAYVDPKRGLNFLEYFFDGPEYSAQQRRLIQRLGVRELSDFPWIKGWSRHDCPALSDSLELFSRNYRVNSEINAEVDRFAKENFLPQCTLGVHFRGTDKWCESSFIEFEESARLIQRCMQKHPAINRIFVATDSQPYLDFVRTRFGSLKLLAYDDHVRSSNADAVHLSKGGDPYSKGRDALLNCLLLSRCDFLLKTISNLSGWSKVFNPTLPVYLMNQHTNETLGFPEREMVEQGLYADKLL